MCHEFEGANHSSTNPLFNDRYTISHDAFLGKKHETEQRGALFG